MTTRIYTHVQFHSNIGNPAQFITKMAALSNTCSHTWNVLSTLNNYYCCCCCYSTLNGFIRLVVFVCEHLLSTKSMMTLLKKRKNKKRHAYREKTLLFIYLYAFIFLSICCSYSLCLCTNSEHYFFFFNFSSFYILFVVLFASHFKLEYPVYDTCWCIAVHISSYSFAHTEC